VKLRYFAWVRERVGKAEEDVEAPAGIRTVGELVAWLATRGPEYEAAFAEPRAIRVALDKCHAAHNAPLRGAREVALFPPMTGG
jgi:molybdopterin synthase sulfur carrier subunit